MTLKQGISNMLFGLSVPQEYVCLGHEHLDQPFHLHLTTKQSHSFVDITDAHCLLGYKPVVLGLIVGNDQPLSKTVREETEVCITLCYKSCSINERWNGFASSRDAIAKMTLQKVETISIGSTTLVLLQARYGVHSFISPFHQLMNRLKEKLKKQKNDTLRLDGNLSDQVRIAYSVPRVISLITLRGDDGMMNVFPTDLHGAVGLGHYVSSLRMGGKASAQADAIRKIVLSDVKATAYNDVYRLGKNHMKELRDPSEFTTEGYSETLKVPLPADVIRYYELQVIRSTDIGIHRIYVYQVLNKKAFSNAERLTHLHQYAVQWRDDHLQQTPSWFRS